MTTDRQVRAVKEDEVLSYLIAGLSPTEAAVKANRSASTVYRMMSTPRFSARLHEARAAQLRPHVEKLNTALGEAIDRLRAIMNDSLVVASTQVRAAIGLAELAIKLGDQVDVRHQLAALNVQLDELGKRGRPADGTGDD